MSRLVLYVALAAVMAALIPLVPKMMQMRIWLLRKLLWNKLAAWHERHFSGIVLAVRLILAAIGAVFLVLAFGS